MKRATRFSVHPGWQVFLKDAGIPIPNVLRRAELPGDFFTRHTSSLLPQEYYRLWQAIDDEAADPQLAIRLGSAISVESFDAPIFAALCSPDLNTALGRIAHYKPLIGPMTLEVTRSPESTTLSMHWPPGLESPPPLLEALELVFFVHLGRLATRETLRPLHVGTPNPPQAKAAFAEYFGRAVQESVRPTIAFSTADAERPFLTANEGMWKFFEPELQKRLSELAESATFSERVRGALLELLPSGSSSLGAVAKRLAVSTRTLQRRLKAEDRSYQQVLDATREQLARHYLHSSSMSGAEISFLLGFEEPSSFFRAFHAWTGETPEQVRIAGLGSSIH